MGMTQLLLRRLGEHVGLTNSEQYFRLYNPKKEVQKLRSKSWPLEIGDKDSLVIPR